MGTHRIAENAAHAAPARPPALQKSRQIVRAKTSVKTEV